jgi:hypothetical protein
MLISRRSTLVSASALAASSLAPTPSLALAARSGRARAGDFQSVEHLLIHADEANGQLHCANLSFPSGDTAWISVGNLDAMAFATATTRYSASDYGLRRLNAFLTQRGVRYAAIWQLGAKSPAKVLYDMTLSDFRGAAEVYARKGYDLVHVDGAATASGVRFAAIWDDATGPAQQVFAELTEDDLAATQARLAAKDFRVRQIAGYVSGDAARFAVILTAGAGGALETAAAIPASQFRTRNRAMMAQGYRLRDASGYVAGGRPLHTAVWEKA